MSDTFNYGKAINTLNLVGLGINIANTGVNIVNTLERSDIARRLAEAQLNTAVQMNQYYLSEQYQQDLISMSKSDTADIEKQVREAAQRYKYGNATDKDLLILIAYTDLEGYIDSTGNVIIVNKTTNDKIIQTVTENSFFTNDIRKYIIYSGIGLIGYFILKKFL